MTEEKKYVPSFDEIVFEKRNKEYGAFELRKKYQRRLALSTGIGVLIICVAIIIPYIRAKRIAQAAVRDANEVVAAMADNLQQDQAFTPPPPPPPPPSEQQVVVKYVAPVVVDSVKPEDHTLASTDEQVETTTDEQVMEVVEQPQEEVQQEETQQEQVFVVVEEMPSFPGGDAELMKFINENIQYPEVAKENNIQGKVIMRFCVTSKGTVDQVSVARGVDPTLDEEAIRVVKLLPLFKPGKQGGKPVNVWYSLPISFQLK